MSAISELKVVPESHEYIRVGFECDVCHKKVTSHNEDFFELQEMIHIRNDCGYGSVFGDGYELALDICQTCVLLIFERYLPTPDKEPGNE